MQGGGGLKDTGPVSPGGADPPKGKALFMGGGGWRVLVTPLDHARVRYTPAPGSKKPAAARNQEHEDLFLLASAQ